MTVTPAARAASTTSLVLASIFVEFMTSATAPLSAPPSEVKSFWYSISTSAVVFGSMAMTAPWRTAVDRTLVVDGDHRQGHRGSGTGPQHELVDGRRERPEGTAAVGDRVLLLVAHLRGRALVPVRDENRAVAEAAGAAPGPDQHPLDRARHDPGLPRRESERRGALEVGATMLVGDVGD